MIGVPNLVMLRHLTRPKENPSKRELQLRGDGTRETKFPLGKSLGTLPSLENGYQDPLVFKGQGTSLHLDTKSSTLKALDFKFKTWEDDLEVVRTTLTVKHS